MIEEFYLTENSWYQLFDDLRNRYKLRIVLKDISPIEYIDGGEITSKWYIIQRFGHIETAGNIYLIFKFDYPSERTLDWFKNLTEGYVYCEKDNLP